MKKKPGKKLVTTQIDEEIYALFKMTASYQNRNIDEVMDDALRDYVNVHLPLKRTIKPKGKAK
ncbi:MAG: hypothetical protein JXR49_09465 [Acidobacteria bacterium]|nr:hypothetical protein [Acidobacteriota bacterium]